MSEESTSGLKLGEIVWSRFINKRLLVKERNSDGKNTLEYTVREVSPSGLRVKMENSMGRMFWTDHTQYIPVEVLP